MEPSVGTGVETQTCVEGGDLLLGKGVEEEKRLTVQRGGVVEQGQLRFQSARPAKRA